MLPIESDFKLNPTETLQIIGVDAERLKMLMPSLTDMDMQELELGKACLIKNPVVISYDGADMETTSFLEGDVISIRNTELKVLGNCDFVTFNNEGFVNGIQVIVFDKIYDYLTGKTSYSELYPVLENKKNIDEIEHNIENICNEIAGSHWLSFQNTNQQLEESYQQIKLLAWGVILFIGLIGLLNIINTIYTTLHTRINEIGIQRAIGMSKKSLYKTFLWEGVYYGIIAVIFGTITGYVCTIFVEAAITEQIQLVAFPVISAAQAAMATVLSCFITTCLPLRQIAKMSIINSIETIE